MTLQRTTIASLATLDLGTLGTVAALVQAGGSSALLSTLALLALIPYAVFGGACFLSGNSRGRAIVTLAVCALATVFALVFYCNLIFVNPGSMSGLVFFLAPFFQLPVAILLLVVMFFARLRKPQQPD